MSPIAEVVARLSRLEDKVRVAPARKVRLRVGADPDPERLRRAVDKAVIDRKAQGDLHSEERLRDFLLDTMEIAEVNDWLREDDERERDEAWRRETQEQFRARAAREREAAERERARRAALTPEERKAEEERWAEQLARLQRAAAASAEGRAKDEREREAARKAERTQVDRALEEVRRKVAAQGMAFDAEGRLVRATGGGA